MISQHRSRKTNYHPNIKQKNSYERGYNARWRKARALFLTENPLCVHCKDNGKITEANTVDHAIAHKGDYNLFWNEDNWQALCASCHSKKTVREDGGFGMNRG